jgi:hypothetical protein
MVFSAAIGLSQVIDAREAGLQAAQQAIAHLGPVMPKMGLVIVTDNYSVERVLSGVLVRLDRVPLLGFSTSAVLTSNDVHRRSVIVALLGGDSLIARSGWWYGFAENSRKTAQTMLERLAIAEDTKGLLLIAADGLRGDAEQICSVLPSGDLVVAGCTCVGEMKQLISYQIGGGQSGSDGLAGSLLSGGLVVGVGVGHGWQRMGPHFRVTRAHGSAVWELDGKPITQVYADLFGYPIDAWTVPPLNELVRLYPWEIEQDGTYSYPLKQGAIRSPLRMDAEGFCRFNTSIEENSIVHLMVGSQEACLEAARSAVQAALGQIGEANPIFALILIDRAWDYLMKDVFTSVIEDIHKMIGKDVSICGGLTVGQIASNQPSGAVQYLHQCIEVIILAEKLE